MTAITGNFYRLLSLELCFQFQFHILHSKYSSTSFFWFFLIFKESQIFGLDSAKILHTGFVIGMVYREWWQQGVPLETLLQASGSFSAVRLET